MTTLNDGCVKIQVSTQAKTFEEAVSLTGHGKFHYLILLCSGLCLVTFVMDSLCNAYVLSSAQCDFNMTSSEKGLLTSIIYVGMILTAHLWGFLADTQGRRKMLFISLCLDLACSVSASIVPTFLLYVILRFLNGCLISCASSVSFVYLGEFHSDKTRTKSMVWVCVFFAVGTTILPVLAWLVIPQTWNVELPWCSFNSWRIFVLLSCVPGMLTCICLWLFVPESPKYLLAAGRKEEALAILQKMYTINTGNAADLYPVTDLKMEDTKVHATESVSPLGVLKHMWDQTKPVFMPPYLISTILACCIQFGLYSISNGLNLWLPDIYNQMNEYKLIFPNESATICSAISSLHDIRLNTVFSNNISAIHGEIFGVQSPDQLSNYSMDYSMLTTDLQSTVMVHENVSFEDRSTPEVINECQPNISFESFQLTLIMGITTGFAFLSVGYLLKFIKKKLILLVFLIVGGCCGIALYFAQTYAELMALPILFFIFPTMCISVINNVVVEAFPTRLRAMALSLSLMAGRIGTMCTSMLFGVLLETNCEMIFVFLCGVVIVGGILSQFIPVSKSQD